MDVRPLYHPPLEEITVEGILHALSDPVRVAIYVDIVTRGCAQNCSSFLTVLEKPIPKSTLSLHFKALREAGLIRGERKGVEVNNTARCAEIGQRFPGLLQAIVDAYAVQMKEQARARKPLMKRPARRNQANE